MNAVVDNDIVLKGACYGLIDEILLPSCELISLVGVLGASRFVTRKRVANMRLNGDANTVVSRLDSFFARAITMEPTAQEAALAAEIELIAQRCRVNLDSGESQLCALLIVRGIPLLLTGDKRAICALETLLDADRRLLALSNKVRCLEQLILTLLLEGQWSILRASICGEPHVDKALSVCFSCASGGGNAATFVEGIQSYIFDLRSTASRVLTA